MNGDQILSLGVAGLARAIAAGKLSSREATQACLDALATRAPALNALARLRPEAALKAADAADAALARGERLGAMHGVPLAHKDMFHRAGELSEYGSTLFKGNSTQETASVLARLDAAGAIDLGRLNMVEFALGITGHNAHTGHPRNPLDPTRITGGSTSGGAASVAAGLIPATLGSDTGGSIRVPAAICGLVGLKPTYGRVSRHGCMPLSASLDHIGPLARSAEDCALVLGAIAGHDPLDPTTSRLPVPDYAAGIERSVAGLRLGEVVAGLDVEVAPEIAECVSRALGAFKGLGVGVEPLALPSFEPLQALRRVVMLAEAAALHGDLMAAHRDAYNPQTTGRMLPGFALPATAYSRALMARGPLLERFCAEAFRDCDILAMPASPIPTPRIADTDSGGDARFAHMANLIGALAGPFNYLGLPALSLPIGLDAAGMPVGLQLVGRPFSEGLLLRVGHAFERASGLAEPRPHG